MLSSGLRAKDGLLGQRKRSGSGAGADSVAGADEVSDYNEALSPPVYEILCFIGLVMTAPRGGGDGSGKGALGHCIK